MSRFVCKYEYTRLFGTPRHRWTCVGRHGAIDVHIEEHDPALCGTRFGGGCEAHYRQPPDYMEEDAPSHEKCWLLGQPCWHDGSSLYAEEHWIPLWRASPHDHEGMFRALEHEYRRRFADKPVEV